MYRIKNRLLGRPLATEQLAHERLGKPTALAVFASDNLSSSAYATEEILRVLVPAVGVAAFAMVVPITLALLVVLAFLILSYLQTIKAYPSAGGAYIVTRDNFGLLPAQVAGVALLTDYILTVAVSVAAGTAALGSAFSGLAPYALFISIAFVVLIAYGNLRGVRESGRLFAVPTYFFIANMVVLLGIGIAKMLFGHLPVETLHHAGLVSTGTAGSGIFLGATLYIVLHAFASGGAAVTGVEAISNGVPAFREPAWKNARITLVIMGSTLGVMFLGLSILAAKVHAAPYEKGTPDRHQPDRRLVYGGGTLGDVLFYGLQAGTMLILVLAANTSFADFPRLASFHAEDNFMPRQLTKRGHRLVFSNGIIFLAVASIAVLLGHRRQGRPPHPALRDRRVHQLHALAGRHGQAPPHAPRAELARRPGHQRHRRGAVVDRRHHHRDHQVHPRRVVHHRAGADHGGRARAPEPAVRGRARRAQGGRTPAAQAPVLRRHAVIVLIDQLDVAAARAIQYARPQRPTSCAPCTSTSTRSRPKTSRTRGAISASPGSRSTSSSAPTA